MNRLYINILTICETRWENNGYLISDRIIYNETERKVKMELD